MSLWLSCCAFKANFSFFSDFPGGEGESHFVGRGTAADIPTQDGRLMYGLDHLDVDEGKGLTANFVEKVNEVLQ